MGNSPPATPTRIIVRRMRSDDLSAAAEVHRQAFVRQKLSQAWLTCALNAAPRTISYVAIQDDLCLGYLLWTQKSGFRPEVVLELEQIAVLPAAHGQGIGRQLIEQSLPDVKTILAEQDSVLKHIVVTTRADNHAQRLYRKTLGAEVEAVISNLYSADEVFMVARHCPP